MGKEFRRQYAMNKIMGIPNHPPCANCGKIDGGFMNGCWGHKYQCCSDRCGKRLDQRIENGMFPEREELELGKDREKLLRYRIKHLEKQLKQKGIKSRNTVGIILEDHGYDQGFW